MEEILKRTEKKKRPAGGEGQQGALQTIDLGKPTKAVAPAQGRSTITVQNAVAAIVAAENAKVGQDGWHNMHCPGHDDGRASLGIKAGDRAVLLKCQAGCPASAVRAAFEARGFQFPGPGARKGSKAKVAGDGWQVVVPVPADAPPIPKVHPKLGGPVASWEYRDAAGELLCYRLRFEPKEFRPLTLWRRGKGVRWQWKALPAPRPLYGLDRLADRPEAPILLCEGERAADVAGTIFPDHVAVAWPDGAGNPHTAAWEPVKGRRLVLWPDNDDAGRGAVDAIGKLAAKAGAGSFHVVQVPSEFPEGWDLADPTPEGWAGDELRELLEAASEWSALAEAGDAGDGKFQSQAQALVKMAGGVELFSAPDGELFGTFPVGQHRETFPVRSKGCRDWLTHRYYLTSGTPPSTQGLNDALGVLDAKARFEGETREVSIRIGGGPDGGMILDLGNPDWTMIEARAEGWRVVQAPAVRFRRGPGMRPLPLPRSGATLKSLRSFLNTPDNRSWQMVCAWLVAALNPAGPYPILVLQGEQGSAKSTTARVLRALVDPSSAPLRAIPRSEHDLMISARNSWVLALDNLSGVAPWLSDALCRMSTGGGFATRALWTNADEALFDAQRPAIITGIDDILNRNDLADRALVVNLPRIPEGTHTPEADLWARFEDDRPLILGALLDAVSMALKNLPTVDTAGLPRMADFARWVIAAEPALPWEAGSFLDAYQSNRGEVVELALEGDAIAVAVRSLIEFRNEWTGTATELLAALEENAEGKATTVRSWPKSARALSGRLRRAATFLRTVGVEIECGREGHSRRVVWSIRQRLQSSVHTVRTVRVSPENGQGVSSGARTQIGEERKQTPAADANGGTRTQTEI